MKSKKLIDAMENVNEEYIDEAVSNASYARKPKILVLAACLTLVLVCAAVAYGVASNPNVNPEKTDGSQLSLSSETEGETTSETELRTTNNNEITESVTAKVTELQGIGNKMQSMAQRVVYEGNDYIICGSAGEGEILKKCGLPETLTAECAGKGICEIKTADGIVWTPDTDTVIYESEAAMYEYALYPTKNVYILYLDGTYYAAIRYDNGYCSVYDN